jgi:hypothetical protein
MNSSQLDKINKKFSEYISYNNELVNITILVDESDLMAPKFVSFTHKLGLKLEFFLKI